MATEHYTFLDDDWFQSQYSRFGIDPRTTSPPKLDAHYPADPHFVDVRGYDFATLFDALNLFLLVDYIQYFSGPTTLQFTGLQTEDGVLSIDEYNDLRRQSRDPAVRASERYLQAKRAYRFLAFLHHYGLFDCLRRHRYAHQVACAGLTEEIQSKLYEYSGITDKATRVLKLFPIHSSSDLSAFRSQQTIDNWISQLPAEVRSAPVFADGEFSRVFGYQLALNMIEHSHPFVESSPQSSRFKALGAVAMRVVPDKNLLWWVQRSFPGPLANAFGRKNRRGLLEICVGDNGIGLLHTLREPLTTVRKRFGLTPDITTPDLVGFAFDEIGSSKPPETRWGGVHALHRLLKGVAKYQGILRLRTGGVEFIYDMTTDSLIQRGRFQLGILPSDSNILSVNHPFGVQLQLLLPLTNPARRSSLLVNRSASAAAKAAPTEPPKMVAAAAYFTASDAAEPAAAKQHLERSLISLANLLMEEPATTSIVYDFGGYEWTEEQFAYFMHSQKRVLHTHSCLGIAAKARLIAELRERERLNPSEEHKSRFGSDDFFEVLSTKHRLVPVYDTEGGLSWLGLGKHNLDSCFAHLFNAKKRVAFDKLCEIGEVPRHSESSERLDLYLKANTHLFNSTTRSGKSFWACTLRPEHIEQVLSVVIRSKIHDLLRRFGCVHTGNAVYKLPSRSGFAREFIETTPLFQDEASIDQVSSWAASELRKQIPKGETRLLLVSATAPAAVFARGIADACWDLNVDAYDLGHYFALDDESVLNKDEWEEVNTIIIADIVDEGKTLSKIYTTLCARGLSVIGIVSLVAFVKRQLRAEDARAFFWDKWTDPDSKDTLPVLFVTEWPKPEQISDEEAKQVYGNENRFLIEPYLLHPFRYSSLTPRSTEAPDQGDFDQPINEQRMQLLEEIGALRAGHLVYGAHHFAVTTCVRGFLKTEEAGGSITEEVIRICDEQRIDHIMVPFHSHIADILPRVLAGIKLLSGRSIRYTFCVSTRVLAERSFYMLPNTVAVQLDEAGKRKKRRGAGLRVLLLDDAVASGRTFETLLRALIRGTRSVVTKYDLKESPLEHVHAYAVLDRQGRASGTWWTGVREVALQGDGEWNAPHGDPTFTFRYGRWIDFDMPVYEADGCPLCHEVNDLRELKKGAGLPDDHSLMQRIADRIRAIKPKSTETPGFVQPTKTELPHAIQVGRFRNVQSVELALWEFYNLLHRGFPAASLIELIKEVYLSATTNDNTQDAENVGGDDAPEAEKTVEEVHIQYGLVEEFVRIVLRSWSRVTTQWATQDWLEALKPIVSSGEACVRWILAEAGRALAHSDATFAAEGESDVKEELFTFALRKASNLTDEDDPSGVRRETLAEGCSLFVLLYNFYSQRLDRAQPNERLNSAVSMVVESRAGKRDTEFFLRDVIHIGREISYGDEFVPALISVADHTLRYARSSHAHLLPFGLDIIARGYALVPAKRRSCRNNILEFMHCLRILQRRHPPMFHGDADLLLPHLFARLESLQEALEKDMWEDDRPSDKVRALARKLRVMFPNQPVNSVYQSVLNTHMLLTDLLSDIKTKTQERGIQFDVHWRDPADSEAQLSLLVPDHHTITEAFLNFTANVAVDRSHCEIPKILVAIWPLDTVPALKRVRISIFGNLRSLRDAKRDLPRGPGMRELQRRDFALFGITSPGPKFSQRGPDGQEYTSEVSVEIVCGFPFADDGGARHGRV